LESFYAEIEAIDDLLFEPGMRQEDRIYALLVKDPEPAEPLVVLSGTPAVSPTTLAKSRRQRAARQSAERAVAELYAGGVPDQVPNKRLCATVGEQLKAEGLPPVSDDTILRAAGRRK
jgi:hypothetical protein